MECRRVTRVLLVALPVIAAWVSPSVVRAGVNVSAYGVHMDPVDQDAKQFSRASYGGGVHASWPIPGIERFLSGGLGIEYINMLSETHVFQEPSGLRVEQQTSQNYFRVFLGPEFGPQGNGFFRPHVGVHASVINYGISVDAVVPDDANRENEIRQNLRSTNRTVFGYGLSAGTDLNFGDWFLTGGARFTRSFNVPQQLGGGAVSIQPGYVQIYVGVGGNFRY